MILSDDCDLQRIKEIAIKSGLDLFLNFTYEWQMTDITGVPEVKVALAETLWIIRDIYKMAFV